MLKITKETRESQERMQTWEWVLACGLVLRAFARDERGSWFIWLLVGLVLNVVAYLLLPKPKKDKPPAATDMDNPTADANRPVPVIFGTLIMKGLNIIDYRDKNKLTYDVET